MSWKSAALVLIALADIRRGRAWYASLHGRRGVVILGPSGGDSCCLNGRVGEDHGGRDDGLSTVKGLRLLDEPQVIRRAKARLILSHA
ncbi:hypothetical protein CHELA40_12272 [Chelatococcus asaccharovorans]|nr:hypothetical protein CHELA40_12272 [Chelatococcus asaccharovorans]